MEPFPGIVSLPSLAVTLFPRPNLKSPVSVCLCLGESNCETVCHYVRNDTREIPLLLSVIVGKDVKPSRLEDSSGKHPSGKKTLINLGDHCFTENTSSVGCVVCLGCHL